MPVLTMPSQDLMRVTVRPEFNTTAHTSPYNKATYTTERPGMRWVFTYELPRMRRETAALWSSFFTRLRGKAGRFYGGSVAFSIPQGPAGGVPLVKGASQTGNTLAIDGCDASVTGWLKEGDHFQVGDELKVITADIDTDGAGEATLQFEPPLRSSPADNAGIITSNPQCVLMLAADNVGWSEEAGIKIGFSFTAVEAFT